MYSEQKPDPRTAVSLASRCSYLITKTGEWICLFENGFWASKWKLLWKKAIDIICYLFRAENQFTSSAGWFCMAQPKIILLEPKQLSAYACGDKNRCSTSSKTNLHVFADGTIVALTVLFTEQEQLKIPSKCKRLKVAESPHMCQRTKPSFFFTTPCMLNGLQTGPLWMPEQGPASAVRDRLFKVALHLLTYYAKEPLCNFALNGNIFLYIFS